MFNTNRRLVAVALLCVVAHGFGLFANARAASPNMVRIHTWEGGKHFGPLIDETDGEVAMFDIAAATTVNIKTSAIKSKLDEIDELRADSYVPFASYAAWKLGKILHSGRLEATVVHNSEKGVFINRGSEDGIESGRRCVLLGDPETIVDPTTDEVLGIIREQLGDAVPLTVVSERLSKLDFPEPADEKSQEIIDTFAVKRQVEVEQQTKRIVLAPPRWKPTGDAESLEDDANFLHAHLIAELVRYGFTVVSKKQTELTRQSIADERQIDATEVPDIEIAKGAKADVLVSVDMLAKGITCQVQLQVTDLDSDEYLGIVSGSTRRKEQKEESARSVAFAQGIMAGKQLGLRMNRTVVSLFALASEVHFNDNGRVTTIRWGNRPMTLEQFDLVCGLKSLQSFQCNYRQLNDSDVKKLAACTEMNHLGIWGTQITEASCKTIANDFPKVFAINIGGTKSLTERGAKILATKQQLVSIYAFATNLTDAGLVHLATLPKLHQLVIRNCKVSDQGLAALHDRHSLRLLDIRRTRVSKQGVESIRAALPKCNVVSDF
ncbi:hypothetical protein [Rhodopirellula europaea]|uniref:hypothetical protein n=1 Tax=Rhodopirellula europaea TaxID=1263866 RepID=UPI003D2CBB23